MARGATSSGIFLVRTLAGYAEAEALCRRAIAMAPGYGQAHSLLAWVLTRRHMLSIDLKTILREAGEEARAALGLDEQDPWAHMSHGMVLFRMRRPTEAERAYRRASDLNPSFALAHAALGHLLAVRGANEEAVESAERALRLSPNDPCSSVVRARGSEKSSPRRGQACKSDPAKSK